MPLVDYDTIIKVQTISWFYPDVDLLFELANYSDHDVHVSLLYDVDEDDPADYAGIRVGYPAGKDDRIGIMTPPGSPRKFTETTLAGEYQQDPRQYIGDIRSVQVESRTGVLQTLRLQNPTGISELSIVDSPLLDEQNDIIDATAWMERVTPLSSYASNIQFLPPHSRFNQFDRRTLIGPLYDDITLSADLGLVEGNLYLPYDEDHIHIAKIEIEFKGGLDPEYRIYGLGESGYVKSPARIYMKQEMSRRGVYKLQNNGAFRVRILLTDKVTSKGVADYVWDVYEYGFNETNWRQDKVRSMVSSNLTNSVFGSAIVAPERGIIIINESIDELAYNLDLSAISNMCSGTILTRSFGTVRNFIDIELVASIRLSWISNSFLTCTLKSDIVSPDGISALLHTELVQSVDFLFISSAQYSRPHLQSW